MDLWQAAVLGIVEGITEFLPVSSTGHLILANSVLGHSTEGVGGQQVAGFDIVIQGGAILAVLVLFWERFVELCTLQRKPTTYQQVVAVAVFPFLVAGALFGSAVKRNLFGDTPVAWGLIVGGIFLILVSRWYQGRGKSLAMDNSSGRYPYSIRHGLIVGLCQLGALWPGMSRAACTIIGGVLAGLPMRAAAELSFVVAVPVLLAASAHSLLDSWAIFDRDMLLAVAVGFLVSFIFALATVRWFMWFLGRVGLAPFGWYRIAVGVTVLFVLNQ